MEQLIEDERERKRLLEHITQQSLPFTVSIKDGRVRSIEQNRLQWMWANEASLARQDTTAADVQAEWKLAYGVPLLIAENEDFALAWQATETATYEEQIKLMRFVNVTSIMTSKQISRYLTEVFQHNVERGIELTDPEDLRWRDV